ncbi:MAG: hypothetical protein GY940_10555 [bacterium]|nr:hypothetical protein [bacterium]
MKQTTKWQAGVLLIGTMLMFLILPGCGSDSGNVKPAVKTSFKDVTSHLDKGGSFYLYASAEKFMKGVEEFAGNLRGIIEKEDAHSAAAKEEWLKTYDFVFGLIKKSGFMDISGIGVSSVAIDETLNHTKVVIHHYKGKGTGVLWQLTENKPRELKELKMLPANTVMAGFGEFKIKTLWEWVKKEVAAADLPKCNKAVQGLEPMLKQMGIELDQLLNSFGDSRGYVVTLDSANKKQIPMGRMALEIPDPALAIIIPVTDDYLFNLLKSKMPFAKMVEKDNTKRLQIPMQPMPITLEPVIVYTEGYLMIASNNKIVDDILAAKKNGDGLTTTEEFKTLSAHMPAKGNGFRFTGSKFSETLMESWKKIATMVPDEKKRGSKGSVELFAGIFPEKLQVYAVTRNTEEGTVTTVNHTMGVEYVLLMPSIAVTGIVAAIAVPNLLTALQKGKQKATMGDMKSIAMAIESYIVDNYKAPEGKNLEELKKVLMPFYIKTLPTHDAWGHEFHYAYGSDGKKDSYSVGTGGKDGVFEGWEQEGTYWVRTMKDFENDIIISNGNFTLGPKVK